MPTKTTTLRKFFSIHEYFQYMVKSAGCNEDVLGFDNLLIYRAENICTMREKCIYTRKLAPAPKIPYKVNPLRLPF